MNAKTFALRLAAFAAIAVGSSAAMADSVTIVTDGGMSQASRAEVRAQVLKQDMRGYTLHAGEAGAVQRLSTPMSTTTREALRAGAVSAQMMIDDSVRG